MVANCDHLSRLKFSPAAMSDFVRRNQIDLMERFAREDIDWAKEEALVCK